MSDVNPGDMLGSQPERTALAWSRTLIGLSAVIGFLAVHAAVGGAATVVTVVLGVGATVTLVTSSLVSRRTWLAATRAMAGEQPAGRPIPMAVMSAATVLVAVVSFVLVMRDWR